MRRQSQTSWRAPKTLLRSHKPDSDESISDEDHDDVFPSISNTALSSHSTNMQELPLPARLDILRGINDRNLSGTSSFEKPLEDEIEMPDFNDEEVIANSTDEENNSADGDNIVLSTRQLQKYGPQPLKNEQVSNINRISEALLHSNKRALASNATCSKANKPGIWKDKPRFPLPSVSRKCRGIGNSISNIESLPEIIKAVDPRTSANLDGNYREDDGRTEINSDIEPAETQAFSHGFNLTPMADFYDNLQDKADQLFQKDSRSYLQETVMDSDDSPEPVDSGSTDNDVNDQRIKNTFPGKKTQTMSEQIEEAFGTSYVIPEETHVGALNSLRPGMFGKLQQMMLKEKEKDMDFWKKLQAGARPDSELGCIDVKIISRYHEGKLTVCHCSFGKYTEHLLVQGNSKGMGFGGSESGQSTIIFSPRVCDSINLQVGNWIQLHPPW